MLGGQDSPGMAGVYVQGATEARACDRVLRSAELGSETGRLG